MATKTADTANNVLTKNMTFYEYDGETEVILELYPDNSNEGRMILKVLDEDGDVIVSENINGYYKLSAMGYVVYDDDGEMTDVAFSLDLSSVPAKIVLSDGESTFELTDLEWMRKNAG